MAVLWDGQSGCGVSDQAFVFETYSKNCSGPVFVKNLSVKSCS